ncbi:MAG: hypothetical protein COB98_01225 [Flavobacteriaceae bacterium]|nr:MAG: hypothetical protein COB98_01225 [Flavobacteriaceae bacterium]
MSVDKQDFLTEFSKKNISKQTIFRTVFAALVLFVIGGSTAYMAAETANGYSSVLSYISGWCGFTCQLLILLMVFAWVFNLRFKKKK